MTKPNLETEMIDKLFLELSQFTGARTASEIKMDLAYENIRVDLQLLIFKTRSLLDYMERWKGEDRPGGVLGAMNTTRKQIEKLCEIYALENKSPFA